jgi:serine/threonine-protein kinase
MKVLDFGIAKVLGDLSSITQALAETGGSPQAFTPRYGAPEQFSRQHGATGPWTDVFALARVLVEVASGTPALGGDDMAQLYLAATDPAIRPSLRGAGVRAPVAVEVVLRRALAVNPRERYPTAGECWGGPRWAALGLQSIALAAGAGAVVLGVLRSPPAPSSSPRPAASGSAPGLGSDMARVPAGMMKPIAFDCW